MKNNEPIKFSVDLLAIALVAIAIFIVIYSYFYLSNFHD